MERSQAPGGIHQTERRSVDDLQFRLEKEGAVWWTVFTGPYAHLPSRPASLAEERLWLALQNARRLLVELGVG